MTWSHLPPSIQEQTELVVRHCEYSQYSTLKVPLHVLTPDISPNIGAVRQYLLETFPTEKICMLDDDLEFAVRREDEPTKFRAPTVSDVERMFKDLETWLTYHPIIGISAREGANRNTAPYLSATRQMRVHAIDATMYHRLGIRYDRMELMEDFDVLLQFLERGYANLVLNNYVSNQGGSNVSGGCSSYRNRLSQSSAARRLAELHPEYVKVVTKQTKTSWGGQERQDVIVQWKKAYAAGRTSLLETGVSESTYGVGRLPRMGRTEGET